MHYVYILFSDLLNRYYVGESENVQRRLKEHNDGFFKNSYTSSVTDWNIYLTIDCLDRIQARKVERHIKNMKSRTYIQNLKQYPELICKLKNKYK
ncbi:MAG: GIY-YIG nuclease family protein [Eudoraea sp.]|uniref:GIY-YIG nuclease family protein n=1 Tax=Eudoraea sp. TaxID=1979955 RepID=UPI003C7643F6